MKNKAWIHYHIVTATPKDINGKQNGVQQTYLRMLLFFPLFSFNFSLVFSMLCPPPSPAPAILLLLSSALSSSPRKTQSASLSKSHVLKLQCYRKSHPKSSRKPPAEKRYHASENSPQLSLWNPSLQNWKGSSPPLINGKSLYPSRPALRTTFL